MASLGRELRFLWQGLWVMVGTETYGILDRGDVPVDTHDIYLRRSVTAEAHDYLRVPFAVTRAGRRTCCYPWMASGSVSCCGLSEGSRRSPALGSVHLDHRPAERQRRCYVNWPSSGDDQTITMIRKNIVLKNARQDRLLSVTSARYGYLPPAVYPPVKLIPKRPMRNTADLGNLHQRGELVKMLRSGMDEGCVVLRSISPAVSSNEASDEPGGGASYAQKKLPMPTPLKKYSAAIYDFTRPHTMRGTILASVTGVVRALIESPTSLRLSLVPRALLGMISLLLGNAYIVGINQIFDVDIDKINKPELPVASGALGKSLAWILVLISVTAGPYIVHRTFSPIIFRLYVTGLVTGTVYSIPPFHFKRYPILAGLIIAFVRGVLLNTGIYHAVREALGFPFRWNPAVLFLARFMTVFAGVIAVTKDLPDVKGDRKYNISTFASRRGVKFTARAACLVLALNYVSAIVQGALSPAGVFNRRLMVGGHSLLLATLVIALQRLKPYSQESIKRFYKRIWDLFYLEYLIYPFI